MESTDNRDPEKAALQRLSKLTVRFRAPVEKDNKKVAKPEETSKEGISPLILTPAIAQASTNYASSGYP